MSRIGIVVPYYQRTPGLLERTMRSIVTQRTDSELVVVLVDDASPIPPDQAHMAGWRCRISSVAGRFPSRWCSRFRSSL